MADAPTIDLQEVSKTYRGRVHALRSVSLQVHPGEIFGLLGPNGAGKSTLVKIMMTVVRPTSAVGTVLGRPVGHKPTLARVGYLPEHHRFPQWLTGRQAIDFAGAMCKIPRGQRIRRTAELLDVVNMTDWASRRLGTYSKGMQQRIGLATSLINDPELVLLDEPTDGVDPVGRREIREVLVRLRDEGKSVLVNSHILSELELFCSRVAILVQGTVVRQGSVESLTRESCRYEITVDGTVDQIAPLSGLGSVTTESLEGTAVRLTLQTRDPSDVQPIIDELRRNEFTIRQVAPTRDSLEELFMSSVTDPATGQTLQPGAGRSGRTHVTEFSGEATSEAPPPPPPPPSSSSASGETEPGGAS
ncbi:MAG: ABC transporter ATP-binding protein [Planctomycetota bacterium]|nr:ABC transporter ATP-binding protein [Planctomycetota bacterium]